MGFDTECIPNIQSLAGEYFCPVCRLLVYPNEALQSMCTHLYCKPCLTYVASTSRACPYDGYLVTEADAKPLVETNQVLADTIGKITVHCLYQKSGCTWLGALSESSSHCSGCAFGNSLVVCNRCGIQIVHSQALDHAQVCPGSQPIATSGTTAGVDQTQASTQAGASITTSQATPVPNAQGKAVAAATPTLEQWYQQQYQQYYQSYYGYFPYQQQALTPNPPQPLQPQAQPAQIGSHHQSPYVHQPVKSEPQTQVQLHTQIQAQDLVQPQSHAVAAISQAAPASQSQNPTVAAPLPQTYPSVPPLPQFPSQTFPASHDQAQTHSQTQPIPQAYPTQPRLQNAQVPQCQRFPGQNQSQLHLQHLLPPSQAKTVQNILPRRPAFLVQALQPPAHFIGPLNYLQPQTNQRNQVGLQNNMPGLNQVGSQPTLGPPEMQNLYPQQMSHQHPPQSLVPMQKQQPPVHQQVGVSVHQNQVMQPAQQPMSQQSLSQQPTMGQSSGVVHNQMHQQGSITHPQVASQSHLWPQGVLQGLQKYQQIAQLHQPIMQNHGLEPQMNEHSAIALQGRSGQPAPSQLAVNQVEMLRTENQLPSAPKEQDGVTSRPTVGKQQGDKGVQDDRESGSTTNAASSAGNNVKSTDKETTTKFDTEHKGNQTDVPVESDQRSSRAVEHHEAKNELKSKQMMKEKAANGLVNPGQSPVIEAKGTEADKPGQKIEKMDKNSELPQVQDTLGISSGKNQPPVNHGLLSFQQRAGAPYGQVPAGVSHHVPPPRYPSPVLRPHGPEILPGSRAGFAAAQPLQGRVHTYGLGHREPEGPYNQGHLLPSNASKVSPSAINSFALGSGDERFKPLPGDRLNLVSLEPARRRLFDEGFKHFPEPSPLDSDSFPRSGANSWRPFNRGFGARIPPWPHEKYKVDFNSEPTTRFLPSFNDLGERQLGHRYIGGTRSPMPSHGYRPFDNGPGGSRLNMDDTMGRDRFGFPGHLPRREFEAHANLRMGEQLRGHDMLGLDRVPSHVRGGDQFDPHGLPAVSRLKEQVGLNGFPRRPGDPGFRSRYSLQGFPNDGGSFPFKGDVEPFENSRKRKLETMGWCRICKVDCETMEGLDLHSQTKEHQKNSMDMVFMIKQNAKKYKQAFADCSRNNTREADFEGHDSKKKGIA